MKQSKKLTSSTYKESYIYALVDPFTDEIRYIGQSVTPKKRLLQHVSTETWYKTRKTDWILSLREKGKRPALKILATVPISEIDEAERRFIEEHLSKILLNTIPSTWH